LTEKILPKKPCITLGRAEKTRMEYVRSKGVGRSAQRGSQVLSEGQWRAMLSAVKKTATHNENWRRDYAAIFLGYQLGLRIGEVCILERRHFENLEKHDTLRLPVFQQRERGEVTADIPLVEESTVAFVLDYIQTGMREGQRWLFEGWPGRHITAAYMSRIFSTYAEIAKLPTEITWQSLRNARGVRLWEISRNPVLVAKGLRLKTLSEAHKFAELSEANLAEYKRKLNRSSFDPRTDVERKVVARKRKKTNGK
jgi:integrase